MDKQRFSKASYAGSSPVCGILLVRVVFSNIL